MAKYRSDLPQLKGKLFLTDGGLETTLIFHDGFELPHFAAFDLLNSERGNAALKRYASSYATIATQRGMGFILESPTWRSSPDWGPLLGYDDEALDSINRKAIEALVSLRDDWETEGTPIVISACIGPRGDGYDPGEIMTPEEAYALKKAATSEASTTTTITKNLRDTITLRALSINATNSKTPEHSLALAATRFKHP